VILRNSQQRRGLQHRSRRKALNPGMTDAVYFHEILQNCRSRCAYGDCASGTAGRSSRYFQAARAPRAMCLTSPANSQVQLAVDETTRSITERKSYFCPLAVCAGSSFAWRQLELGLYSSMALPSAAVLRPRSFS
jgi:hypothetical protein